MQGWVEELLVETGRGESRDGDRGERGERVGERERGGKELHLL